MVTATRSRVWEEFGAPSPRKPAAAASLRGFADQLACTEISSNPGLDYTGCLVNKSLGAEAHVKQGRTAGRRPGKQNNPSFKHCRFNAALHGTYVGTVASGAGAENDQLGRQTIRGDVEGPTADILTLSASKSTKPFAKSTTVQATLKFGMYAGRVKANPLKYLATVLRSKLQPHSEACNLLQIATEIHDEAKNKHNTTLRRIYDVVNVLEAAGLRTFENPAFREKATVRAFVRSDSDFGLLERSNGSTPKRSPRNHSPNECTRTSSDTVTGSPSAECSKSAVFDGGVNHEQIDIYSRNRTTFPAKKGNQLEKKSTRGSRIRWLGAGSENEQRCRRQTLGRLNEEKIAAVGRSNEKQRELDHLQEELRLTTELIKHNQSRIYQSNRFEGNMYPCTPPPEDLSYSYLNFEDCSQTSTETERSYESLELHKYFAATPANDASSSSSFWSCTSQDFYPVPNRSSILSEADGCHDFSASANEVGLDILEAAGQYQSNSLPRTISGTAQRGLHVPFVILQTKNTTNVDIDLASNETSEVSIVLNEEYKLFDYRELLSSMFPAQDCDGDSSDMYAS